MQITVQELAAALDARAEGMLDLEISGPAEPATASASQIALAMDPRYGAELSKGQARAAILWDGADWQELGLEAAIFVPRPRYALAGVNMVFDVASETPGGIHPSAVIDPTAVIGAGASIGAFVMIGRDVQIGAGARILSHVSINEGVNIGENSLIFNGVRIGARVRIGSNFIAQPGAVIGGDGFSFVSPNSGAIEAARAGTSIIEGFDSTSYVRINSLGTVVIGDRVEIGANSTIDRGTVANTEIGAGTKVDNLVQIGHNAKIGRNCLLCGMSGVAGSAVLSDNVVLGGGAMVADHVTVGSNVVVTGKSGVASNVPPNRVVMGNPAVKMESSVESYKALRRLPRLMKKFEDLQKRVSKLDSMD